MPHPSDLRIKMEFCHICGNMLYIRTNVSETEEPTLTFYCKSCQFEKQPEDTSASLCITRAVIDTASKMAVYQNPYLQHDPTLPHVDSIDCPNAKCTKKKDQQNDVTYIKYDAENMLYMYLCNHCKYYWKRD